MTQKKTKKILTWTLGSFLFLTLVLAIHIYVVTRPKSLNENASIMARIDIKNPIDQADADKITSWLYQQKGVDHVLINPKSKIVIFTFFPVKTNGALITKNFQTAFNYDAVSYKPTDAEIASGCPVISSSSVSTKIYTYIKHIF